MAATTPGNEFHEDQILGLAHSLASSIWFRILCNDKFHGIEWDSLSKELVNTHYDWFNIDEIAKLSDRKPCSKDALSSAVKRNAPEVLHAFYQSLCATQSCGGAAQHASIAADIQKETLKATITKSNSYPPASNQSYSSWPTDAQLASAEPDFMRQASAGNVTAQFVHRKTTEAQGCRSGTPPMKKQEEWEGVVAFICHHFGGNAPRDVVSALHREIVSCHQSYSFPPSSQQLSEAIKQVVKERCMTWFQFSHYLLLSRTTRPFVFKIAQYTRVGIRFVFKQVLSKHLGSDWYRLACAMGLPKTDVDNIEDQKDISLLGKIDAFLMTYHFPAFKSDEETTEFLVEALERACLSNIAAAVKRDLKDALQREAGTGGGSGSGHIKSSPRSSPSLKHSQVSQSENTSIDMPRVEDQSDVRMQPPTPQGNHAPSQTAEIDGACGGSHKKDTPPPSRSSQSLELNQLSKCQEAGIASKSERSFGPENDSKNVPSHIEAQSGGEMQSPAPQGNRTPDQSSIPLNPLWEAAKTPPVELGERSAVPTERSAVPTATGVSLSQQSQHQPKTPPENADNEHSDADATSLPVTSVERSSESVSPATPTLNQPSMKKDISPGSLILPSSQGRMHPHAHQEGPRLTLFQQSAPMEDNLDGETGDDDDARSDWTYQSSTSTTVTRVSAPNFHPPSTYCSQPPTTHLNRSVNVHSCMELAVVELPEVPSRIEASAEAYPSAATVVEAAHEADPSAVPASCGPVEQPVAFSCGGGSSMVSFTLQDVHRQDSDYLGSNQLSYQGPQDSEATVVEAAHAANTTAVRASPSSVEQQVAVSSGVGSPAKQDSEDEVCLQELCYMPTSIKQFVMSPNGDTITLGSDASLKVSPGTVAEETLVHYAILLHGPSAFPPGYKLGSVIVYLNMDGVRLMKPVSLFLSHWCIKKDGDDEDTLKFFRASHTLDVEQQKYVFQELKKEDSDLTTRINVGVLTIRRSQCLYCVACTTETTARYSAITFSQYIQSEDTFYFRIQFTCASLTWNEVVTHQLQCKKWKKASINDAVAQFQYTDNKQPITARPRRLTGPGWEAAIEGHQAIVEDDFLAPRGKSASEIEREITSGHFPPCIHYKIVYTSPEDLRVKPGMMIIDVDGANVPLSFSCRIQEEKSPTLPISPTSCGAVSATPSPPIMETVMIDAENVLGLFRDRFIKVTDANKVLHELRHRKIISDGDLTEIKKNPDAQQQNEILHRCLITSCDEEALMEVCDMMIAVDGNRRMNTLGREMKSKLEGN